MFSSSSFCFFLSPLCYYPLLLLRNCLETISRGSVSSGYLFSDIVTKTATICRGMCVEKIYQQWQTCLFCLGAWSMETLSSFFTLDTARIFMIPSFRELKFHKGQKHERQKKACHTSKTSDFPFLSISSTSLVTRTNFRWTLSMVLLNLGVIILLRVRGTKNFSKYISSSVYVWGVKKHTSVFSFSFFFLFFSLNITKERKILPCLLLCSLNLECFSFQGFLVTGDKSKA